MFCGMATTRVKPGNEEAIIAAAQDHARALGEQPGCRATYVLLERGASAVVSMSVFETESEFLAAAEKTRPVIASHHLERLWEGPPDFHLFDVR